MFRAAVVGFGQNLRSCLVVIFGSSSLYLTGVSAMMEKVTEGAAPKIGFCVETQRFKRKMPGEEVVCATSPRPPQQECGGVSCRPLRDYTAETGSQRSVNKRIYPTQDYAVTL